MNCTQNSVLTVFPNHLQQEILILHSVKTFCNCLEKCYNIFLYGILYSIYGTTTCTIEVLRAHLLLKCEYLWQYIKASEQFSNSPPSRESCFVEGCFLVLFWSVFYFCWFLFLNVSSIRYLCPRTQNNVHTKQHMMELKTLMSRGFQFSARWDAFPLHQRSPSSLVSGQQ